jgi:hypothetical protein
MMYKLTVDSKEPVSIPGLGVYSAGTYDVDDDQAFWFRKYHQTQTSTVDAKGNLVTKTEDGPTLYQYLKNMDGFTVEKVSGTRTPPPDEPEVTVQTTGDVNVDKDEKKGGDN